MRKFFWDEKCVEWREGSFEQASSDTDIVDHHVAYQNLSFKKIKLS